MIKWQAAEVAETALIVEVPEAEHLVAEWRREHDPTALRGIPAHITALYPLSPPHLLDDVFGELQTVVSAVQLFSYELAFLDEFPGALWLRPAPDEPFRDLTQLLWRSFPDHPPYGGRHPDSQPHLTVAQLGDESLQRRVRRAMENAFQGRLPLRCRASQLSAFTSDGYGNWNRRDAVAFAGERQ